MEKGSMRRRPTDLPSFAGRGKGGASNFLRGKIEKRKKGKGRLRPLLWHGGQGKRKKVYFLLLEKGKKSFNSTGFENEEMKTRYY